MEQRNKAHMWMLLSCLLLVTFSTVANLSEHTITLGARAGTIVAGPDEDAATGSTYASANDTITKHAIVFLPQDACTGTPALCASASASESTGPAPLAVNFTGSATNGTPPYSWSWTFGDGTGHPFEQNPSHTYPVAGTYTVTLTVTDASSATATDNHIVITVTGGGPCTITCSTSVVSSGAIDVPVTFDSTFSASNCAGPPICTWTFGDQTPPSKRQNTTHSYSAPGIYNWTYILAMGGQVCTQVGTISITQGGCALDCSVIVPPTAPIGAAVQFLGEATPSNCTGQPQFAWDFGDKTSPSDQSSPTHIYAAEGAYTWAMTATVDGIPCTKSGTIAITAQVTKPGDCNGDGAVSIGEVQKAINMFLGIQVIDCGVDCNGSATVSIGEVQKVINGFLGLQISC